MNSTQHTTGAPARHRQTQTWEGSSFFLDDAAQARGREPAWSNPATSPLSIAVVVAVMVGALALVVLGHMLRG